jgi:hypothetical protein
MIDEIVFGSKRKGPKVQRKLNNECVHSLDFEFLAAVAITSPVTWDITPRNPLKVNPRNRALLAACFMPICFLPITATLKRGDMLFCKVV